MVDTIKLLMLADENDISIINHELTPVIAACRAGNKTGVFGHHNRKGGGDHGEAAAGGHTFLGIVDVGLELTWDNRVPNRRLIKGRGRVFQVPELLYELQDTGGMSLLGDPHQLELQEVKDRSIECLTDEWQATKEVRDSVDDPKPSSDQLVKALNDLAGESVVERAPPVSEGAKPGRTYRWRLPT